MFWRVLNVSACFAFIGGVRNILGVTWFLKGAFHIVHRGALWTPGCFISNGVFCRYGPPYYLPHHTVIRQYKVTTKLRLVYDASAKAKGPSLNNCLYSDPSQTQNIVDIMLRFRAHKVALTGDIEKAFIMIHLIGMRWDSFGLTMYTVPILRLSHFDLPE